MSAGTFSPPDDVGERMHRLVTELYPICRSITGDGVRQTLAAVRTLVPIEIHEVPTGTRVFDWTVPKEWNIRDAWVKNSRGERVIDFRESNLHVVNYSVPVRTTLSLAELRPRLHTLPDRPDWIPYLTSYYKEDWGFCLSHRRLLALEDGSYEVCIDSTLGDGHLTYGEFFMAGRVPEEVLISSHVCHPSLANDNLSGIALAAWLAKILSQGERRLSYRFLFAPGTIGAITWLARNREGSRRIQHGLVVACVGGPGRFHYQKTRRGDAEIDRAVRHVLSHKGGEFAIRDFSPLGYDERQYGSPGFDLPVGCLTRTPNGHFPENHTSADDLDLVRPEFLADSLATYLSIVSILEGNLHYTNLNPWCEPQLGRRGLYSLMGGRTDHAATEAMLWVLNLSDGRHSLLDIAERAGLPFDRVCEAASVLASHGLLEESGPAA